MYAIHCIPTLMLIHREQLRYNPEVTLHSLETFSLLLARIPFELAYYQVRVYKLLTQK